MPRVLIKQNARASGSRAVTAQNACTHIVWLLDMMCTLSALVLACALIGALGLLWCWSVYCLALTASCELQMFDQEAIVETINERTAIDSK